MSYFILACSNISCRCAAAVLQQSVEEKVIIHQCCSIFCNIAERKPELLHDIGGDLLEAALRVLPKHHKNADICSSVYALINAIAIDERHVKILLEDKNKEFDHLCMSIPMFQVWSLHVLYIDVSDNA